MSEDAHYSIGDGPKDFQFPELPLRERVSPSNLITALENILVEVKAIRLAVERNG